MVRESEPDQEADVLRIRVEYGLEQLPQLAEKSFLKFILVSTLNKVAMIRLRN